MALLFQEKDEIDREIEKSQRRLPVGSLAAIAFFAVFFGVADLLSGISLKEYEETIAVCIATVFAFWLISPLYGELRFRAKETYGKVSAIEEAMKVSKEHHAEFLQRLTAIEEKMTEIQGTGRN